MRNPHRQRGNPNWGRSAPLQFAADSPTHFEQECARLKLADERQMMCSIALRYWANRNRNKHYIPEWLLQTWGMEVEANMSPLWGKRA